MTFFGKLVSRGVVLAGICAGLLVSARASSGIQAAYQYPAAVAVASGSQVETISVSLAAAGTIAAVQVVTQGKMNGDFTAATQGTCGAGATYGAGQSCQIPIKFSPLAPGERRGAVLLLDGNGGVLGTQMLYGIGRGSAGVLLPPTIQTVAGNGTWVYRVDGVAATDASIFLPGGVAVDGLGNLFLSDTSNNRVRRVDASTGYISTVAGTGTPGAVGDGGQGTNAGVNLPSGMVIDGAGNLLFADSGNNAIRKLSLATGVLSTVAGQLGQQGYTGDGGQASAALLNTPEGLALDAAGDLYIADTANNAIRKVNAVTGVITTVAGTGVSGASGDGGPGVQAMLNTPWGIALDVAGDLYIADLGNNRVRELSVGGTMSTVVGTGSSAYNGDDQAANGANVKGPAAVAVDVAGNLYVADSGNNRVRKVAVGTTLISTVAGTGDAGFSGDGGAATLAGMYGPYALALDSQGNLFFSDIFHHRIRELQDSLALLKYPAIRVGRTSAAQLVKVENDGNDVMHITALVADSNSALDPASTTCSTPMAVDVTCVVGAQFAPQVTGNPVVATIQLQSDASNSPAVLSLSGEVDALEPTVTVLASSANPAALNAMVTFTATVSGGGSLPSGNIRFYDGTLLLGTVATGAGSSARFMISTLALGTHPITANFTGDESNSPSTSAVLNQVIKQTPSLALTSSLNPSQVGQNITFSATVTSTNIAPTGAVVFSDGSTTLGNGTINGSGVATFMTASLAAGTHPITASFAGDANTLGGSSAVLSQVVNLWASTTTLATSNASPTVGSAVTLTMHVSTTSGVMPSGQITITDNGPTVTTQILDAQGNASYTTSSMTVGSHTLVAHFGGDTTNQFSDSPAVAEAVQTIGTTTALTSSANPLSAGASVRLTAVVTAATTNAVAGAMTGTVSFVEGTTTLGSGALSAGGMATLDLATLAVGQHAILAVYSGNTNYGTSTSGALNQAVQLAATAVQLTASASSAIAGKSITLTAVVSGSGGVPTGLVTFLDGGASLGTGVVGGSGQATLTVTLSTGTHSVVATYGGDTRDGTSTSNTLTETVQQSASQISLTSSSNPSYAGASVTFVATLTSSGAIPSGQPMVLHEGATVLGSAAMSATGVASFSVSVLSAGSHTLVASYGGDTDHAAADSGGLVQVVQIGTSAVALTSSKNPSVFGDAVVLTINVTGTGNQPGGTVTLMDGASALATLTLTGAGAATYPASALGIGDHVLAAVYGGDVNHAGSTSRVLTQRVQQATTVTLGTNENPSKVGDAVRFTATVAGASGSPISGTVSFADGATVLGSASVSAGVASLDVSTLVAGSHLIVATYSGDATNVSAVSPALAQTVNTAGTTVALTSSANPAIVGNAVVFSAAVVSSGKNPGGVVSFMDGSNTLGTGTVVNGLATFKTTSLAAGQHAIVAQYGGDAGTQSSNSGVVLQVMRQGTTTTLATNVNPALTLQSIVLTATVVNGVNATGVVTFTDGGATLGSVSLGADGTALLTVPSLSAGSHALSASYGGDAYNVASNAAGMTETVQLRPTTILTTASSNTYLSGTQITMVSVVQSSGPVTPTGTVTFTSGGNSMGSAQLSATGAATLPFFPIASSYDVVAMYQGDAVYAPSTAVKYTITQGAPTTFTMVPSVKTLSMASGNHMTFDLNFTSVKGFTDTLALGCLELPVDATCTFSTDKMLLAANGAGVVHLTVDTGNPLGAGAQARLTREKPMPSGSGTFEAGMLLPSALLLGVLFCARRRYKLPPLLAIVLMLAVAGAGLTGCANKLVQSATPAGSYTLRLVASGTQSGATQELDLPITVTQ